MDVKKLVKKTLDIPEELFAEIMDYAHAQKLYKFTPAVIALLRKGLDSK